MNTDEPPHPNAEAVELLEDLKTVLHERGSLYGPACEHFARTAGLVRIYLGSRLGSSFEAEDWAVLMILDKIARFSNPRTLPFMHVDTTTDIAGYASLLAGLISRQHPDHQAVFKPL